MHWWETVCLSHMLGLYEGRHYPNDAFWRIAGETGNRVILGCDAHVPQGLNIPETETEARELASHYGLILQDTIDLS